MMAIYWFTIAAEREFKDLDVCHPALAAMTLGYLFAPTDTLSSGLKAVVHSSIKKLEGVEPSADMATSYFRRALAKLAKLESFENVKPHLVQFWARAKPAVVEWLRDYATDRNAASGSGSTA